MGYIKEPTGIDFIIQSRPLTKAEELAISEHIKNYKLKNNNLSSNNKQQVRKSNTMDSFQSQKLYMFFIL